MVETLVSMDPAEGLFDGEELRSIEEIEEDKLASLIEAKRTDDSERLNAILKEIIIASGDDDMSNYHCRIAIRNGCAKDMLEVMHDIGRYGISSNVEKMIELALGHSITFTNDKWRISEQPINSYYQGTGYYNEGLACVMAGIAAGEYPEELKMQYLDWFTPQAVMTHLQRGVSLDDLCDIVDELCRLEPIKYADTAENFLEFTTPVEAARIAQKFQMSPKALVGWSRYQPEDSLWEVDEEKVAKSKHFRDYLGDDVPYEFGKAVMAADESKILKVKGEIERFCAAEGADIADFIFRRGKFSGCAPERLFQTNDIKGEMERINELLLLRELKKVYIEKLDSAAFLSMPLTEAKKQDIKGVFSSVTLEDMPRLNAEIQKLGIDSSLAAEMLKSWQTYNALAVEYSERLGEYQPNKNHGIADHQASVIVEQYKALKRCVDSPNLGIDKVQEIISLFGIHHFARYTPEELSDQLEVWNSDVSIRHVVASSHADWNSFKKQKPIIEGDGQAVYFEVNSSRDILRLAIKIGKRARERGHEPAVRDFIVHAHGDPDGMLIGVSGEDITVSDYEKLIEQREEIRKRLGIQVRDRLRYHLGDSVRIVLQSCSTAGDNGDSSNIAEMINRLHGIDTVGHSTPIYGVTIYPDGKVQFKSREQGGDTRVYSAA